MSAQEIDDATEQFSSNEKPFRPVDLARVGGFFLLAGLFVFFSLLFWNCVITMGMCSGGTDVDLQMVVALGASGVGAAMLVSALAWICFNDCFSRRSD
jgi:hypothetical protein